MIDKESRRCLFWSNGYSLSESGFRFGFGFGIILDWLGGAEKLLGIIYRFASTDRIPKSSNKEVRMPENGDEKFLDFYVIFYIIQIN